MKLSLALFSLLWLFSAQSPAPLPARIEALRVSASLPAVGAVMFDSAKIGDITVTGVRKVGDPAAVTAADLWHIGSITKSFTSTMIGLRVDRGEWTWDTTLGELVGAERAKKFAPVTLRHLLSHRAGLAANASAGDMMALAGSKDLLPEQRRKIMEKTLSAEPLSAPGTAFLYSNLDYVVAGAILEAKTGKSWEELVRAEVLEPLKLSSAGFGSPGSAGAVTQPRGHRSGMPSAAAGAAAPSLFPVEPGLFADNPPFLGPAGTLHMSIADLARWGQEHLRGERGQDGLLKAATFKTLHTPFSNNAPYGLGWVVQLNTTSRVIWHNGSNTMWYAIVAFEPESDRGVVIVTNGSIAAQRAVDALAMEIVKGK
jgi:CubicO group peptidase (beta-lactamase class C family)